MRVNAAIPRVLVPETGEKDATSWLTTMTNDEIKIIQSTDTFKPGVLPHLDFHPLNVLTNMPCQTITLVIDWANVTSETLYPHYPHYPQ